MFVRGTLRRHSRGLDTTKIQTQKKKKKNRVNPKIKIPIASSSCATFPDTVLDHSPRAFPRIPFPLLAMALSPLSRAQIVSQ